MKKISRVKMMMRKMKKSMGSNRDNKMKKDNRKKKEKWDNNSNQIRTWISV